MTCIFILLTVHFIWATIYYLDNRGININKTGIVNYNLILCFLIGAHEGLNNFSSGYGLLFLVYIFYVFATFYSYLIKPYILPPINRHIYTPIANKILYKLSNLPIITSSLMSFLLQSETHLSYH